MDAWSTNYKKKKQKQRGKRRRVGERRIPRGPDRLFGRKIQRKGFPSPDLPRKPKNPKHELGERTGKNELASHEPGSRGGRGRGKGTKAKAGEDLR